MEQSKLQFERKNIDGSQAPLHSTPVSAKTPGVKIPATKCLERKGKAQKDYLPEDPE